VDVPIARAGSRREIVRSTIAATHELLGQADRPDAILGLFEDSGPGILNAARAHGLDVPGELQVAQDVDGLKPQLCHPAVTALDLHPIDQVREAIRLLLDDGPKPQHVTTQVTLSVRESSTRAG
jgi:DNA-binding LacI/PurR family transcriptional regulator